MKLIELLEAVTALRGQQYATDTLVGWANEIEGQVIDEVVNMAEGFDLEFIPMEYGVDDDRELESVMEIFEQLLEDVDITLE